MRTSIWLIAVICLVPVFAWAASFIVWDHATLALQNCKLIDEDDEIDGVIDPDGIMKACDDIVNNPNMGQSQKLSAMKTRAANHWTRGDLQDALKEYSQLIERQPDDAEHRNSRAQLLGEMRQYSAAVADWEIYLKLRPNDVDGLIRLASTYQKDGFSEKALPILRQALEFETYKAKRIFILQELAASHRNLAEFKQALDLIKEADDLGDVTEYGELTRGIAHFFDKNHVKAVKAFGHSTKKFP